MLKVQAMADLSDDFADAKAIGVLSELKINYWLAFCRLQVYGVCFCPLRLRNGSFHFAHSCRTTSKNTPPNTRNFKPCGV